jgi:hypothetical protein
VSGLDPPSAVVQSGAAGCGNSSVVEHDLAKVGVAGSNPVSRSSKFSCRLLEDQPARTARFAECRKPRKPLDMAHRSGSGLIFAGTILSVIGVGIVLIKVLNVPEYWVPLIVGLGLILIGVIRRSISSQSGSDPK